MRCLADLACFCTVGYMYKKMGRITSLCPGHLAYLLVQPVCYCIFCIKFAAAGEIICLPAYLPPFLIVKIYLL